MNPRFSMIKPGFNRFSLGREALEDTSVDEGSPSKYEEEKNESIPEDDELEMMRQDDLMSQVSSVRPSMIGVDEDSKAAYLNRNNKPSAKEVTIKEEVEEVIVLDKPKDPRIKMRLTEPEMIDSEHISINNWIELQEYLKNNLATARSEAVLKESLTKKLEKKIKKNAKLRLQIREKNKKIGDRRFRNLKLELVENPKEALGSSQATIENLLNMIYDNPKIIAILAKNRENLKGLEETLALSFYEDNLAEEESDSEVLRLFSELLQSELSHEDVNKKESTVNKIWSTQQDGFFLKLWSAYLNKTECKEYVKTVLRNPALSFIRERPKIKLDPRDVKEELEKRKMRQKNLEAKLNKQLIKDEKLVKSLQAADANSIPKQAQDGSPTLPKEEPDKIIVPKLKLRYPTIFDKQTTGEEIKDSKAFEFVEDNYRSPLSKIEDREVAYTMQKRFRVLKRHLNILIQSLFDNLENMPVGIRMVCRIIYEQVKKKFPNWDEKEYNKILYNYLFLKWIIPHYLLPGKKGVLDGYEETNEVVNYLSTVAKVVKEVFNLNQYNNEDYLAELNPYITDIAPSIEKYFKELIAVNEDTLKDILEGKRDTSGDLRSRAICVSIAEIKLLCRSIVKQKEDLTGKYNKIVKLAEQALFDDQNDGMLSMESETTNPDIPQTFLLFHNIVFPVQAVEEFGEEFRRVPPIPKEIPDDERVILKVKYGLRNFLINIKGLRGMAKWGPFGDFNIINILEKYLDKPYYIDPNPVNKGERAPPHLNARFLKTLITKLPDEYKENNYIRLCREISNDMMALAQDVYASISLSRFQLTQGLNKIGSKSSYLKKIAEERRLTFKRHEIRMNIKECVLPLCISSPSSIKDILSEANRNGNKKSTAGNEIQEKIKIQPRLEQGCIHEKFSMMKELTISATAITTATKSKILNQSGSFSGASKNNVEEDMPGHVRDVDGFVAFFGSLSEVKSTIATGMDLYGTNEAIVSMYDFVSEHLKESREDLTEEDYKLIDEEVENYICRKLYYSSTIFAGQDPKNDKEDREFWEVCKLHEWVNFDHLEIISRNRQQEMWEYAAKQLSRMDSQITPLEKLDCIMDCFKVITQVLDLAAGKEGSGGADEALPIMIYTVLKACPRRIFTNSNYIEFFRDSGKMQAEKGYCFIQLKSSVMTIKNINYEFLRVTKEAYDELINEKQQELRLLGKLKS